MSIIRFVTATRHDEVSFGRHTRLGITLRRFAFDSRLVGTVAFQNTEGLPTVFNRSIDAAHPDETLVFIHDDVFIDDFFLRYRLNHGLQAYDVVGVAGNTLIDEKHVGWPFWREPWDVEHRWYSQDRLSGYIGHVIGLGDIVSEYGPVPQACMLLDGCFLAVKAATLKNAGVRFDERFTFHFYDVDFCRTCRAAGLRLGTWPLAITHVSDGRFDKPEWERMLPVYREKWAGKPL